MIQKSDKIAIVGAGALGGHVGAYLTREGHDVTLIDAWPEHIEHMRAHGLTLDGATEPECPGMDWGVVAVFSCAESCLESMEEAVIVQPAPDDA